MRRHEDSFVQVSSGHILACNEEVQDAMAVDGLKCSKLFCTLQLWFLCIRCAGSVAAIDHYIGQMGPASTGNLDHACCMPRHL